MSTYTNSNISEPEAEVDFKAVFADPVSYLRQHGIDAELVSKPATTPQATVPVAA
jgi:hypothetical protein